MYATSAVTASAAAAASAGGTLDGRSPVNRVALSGSTSTVKYPTFLPSAVRVAEYVPSRASRVAASRSSAPEPDVSLNTVVRMAAPLVGSIVSAIALSVQLGTMRPTTGASSVVPLRTTAAEPVS